MHARRAGNAQARGAKGGVCSVRDSPEPRIAPQKPAASQEGVQDDRVRARGAVINIVDVYKYLLRHDFHLSCRVGQYPLRGSGSDKEKPLAGCKGLVEAGHALMGR